MKHAMLGCGFVAFLQLKSKKERKSLCYTWIHWHWLTMTRINIPCTFENKKLVVNKEESHHLKS